MSQRHQDLIWGIISLLLGIAAWELLALTDWKVMTKVPPPSRFLPEILSNHRIGLGSDAPTILESVLSSMWRVLSGAAAGFAGAFVLGAAVGFSRPVSRLFMPWLRLLAPVAPVAWVSLVLALYGVGNFSAFVIVILGVFFMVTIATVRAIASTPAELVTAGRAMGLSIWQVRRWVVIPHILPKVFTTFRLGLFAAWMAILAAEMVGLRNGLGYVINYGRNVYRYEIVMMGIALIGVSGALLDTLMEFIQRRWLWWEDK